MIHAESKTPGPLLDTDDESEARSKPVLGKLKTDEEVRLAREIEKLLGQNSSKESGDDA
jgi:hypothetical protein